TLNYLGRLDSEFKIAGVRVNLTFIEELLVRDPVVQQCAICRVQDDSTPDRLVAYVVPKPGAVGVERRLRSLLRGALPLVHVPSKFVLVRTLPLIVNHKLDRRALALGQCSEQIDHDELLEPLSALESQIQSLWSRYLDGKAIRRDDNFFEVGGNSLLLVRVH